MTRTGVVIPIRAFAMGKARLAETLDTTERARLAQYCAERVLAAATGLATLVISSDPEVRAWAAGLGVAVLADPGSLNAAVAAGVAALRDEGCARVVVSHADLPHAATFADVIRDATRPVVTIVPCHRDDGTPVLSIPASCDFRFSYGPASFRRHAAEARRLGLGLRVVRDRSLAFDVDIPDDLVQLEASLLQLRR